MDKRKLCEGLELSSADDMEYVCAYHKKGSTDSGIAMKTSGLDMMEELRRFATMGGRSGKLTIEFLDGGHEALNKLRKERGIGTKPLMF